jgi:F-type H+-transporting ATPase subunit b
MKAAQGRNRACEFMNKVTRAIACGVFAAALLCFAPNHILARERQQPAAAAPAHVEPDRAATEQEHETEEHGLFSGLLWPTVNFVILFGGLWWFLREPFGVYLRDRHASIRKELVEAANVKAAAAAQLAEIDRKLQALPGEIEALRTRGAEEIAAEEQRIATQAATDRDRLLEQTRREIEVQVRLAKRELVEHAANLAVQMASDRLQEQITPQDQERLVDRYLDQVKNRPA